jgi:hypothetical protein
MWFRAPELFTGGMPTSQSDLFTAACSLFVLATNTAPAQGTTLEEVQAEWSTFSIASLRMVRPDIDQPFADWLGWLMQLDPAKRPASVAQALDPLMQSMHTGYLYVPQQAPAMAPGSQTGLLIAGGGSPMHPSAPRPKPIVAKSNAAATAGSSKPSTTAASKPASASPPAEKRSIARLIAILLLNGAALAVLGYAIITLSQGGGRGWKRLMDSMFGSDAPAAASTAAAPAAGAPFVSARYLRVELPKMEDRKTPAILSLAEVQVWSEGKNIASMGEASQSSEEWGGVADRAIDGNTEGDFEQGSVTHTSGKSRSPWWKLDLDKEYPIQAVTLWNRTDQRGNQLCKVKVKLLSKHQTVVWEGWVEEPPQPSVRLDVSPP